MRIRQTVLAAGVGGAFALALLAPREASAQIPPSATRDDNWGTVSNVALVIGTTSVLVTPRTFYSDPAATVGWKGRWHFSVLAPAMTLTAMTVLIDSPIKDAIKSPRPGCTLDETRVYYPGSNCESYGGPSTHSFAAWSATGAGAGIFLVDTLKYSDGRFDIPAFVGEVAIPLTASVITSVARGVEPGDSQGFEGTGQIFAGAIPGLLSGVAVGVAYAMLQRPSCGYGGALFCW